MDVLATILTALVGGPQQHDRLLRLHTPLGPLVLVAETLEGVESLDAGGFRLELTTLSVDAHIELAQLLGQPVLLQLLCADSVDELRPLHGHVSAFERVGSNGGLARYRLVVEPWLAFARQRIDSYVFQDMTVVEIIESVFADYVPDSGSGKLAPAWRWDLADPAVYNKRSLTTQYEESDFAFVERLLAEEGIHAHYEHAGDAGSDSLGAHTLVLADHNDAFADLGTIRFHRSDATERDDSVRHWSTTRRWQTTRVQRASWDYRSLDLRASAASGAQHGPVAAEDIDVAGPYAYPDRATGERYSRQHLEALQVAADSVHGDGSWRRLRPGARFTLSQHPGYPDAAAASFTCLRVHHRARNNLDAHVLAQVEQQLGLAALPAPSLPDAWKSAGALDPGARAAGQGWGERARSAGASAPTTTGARHPDGAAGTDFYHNEFHALPALVPYRPQTRDGHGLRLHPKPTVHGTQTAIVVSDGAPLQTDRDHRIKLQFPWQRGGNAGNRLSHPAGGDNAPANAGAWTWVRVAGPWAGDNWGSVLLPRQGQEVLVAFLEGDIDRPVVIGSVYNGRGQTDAAHNQVAGGAAGATGNAPAWFDGNGHAPVFTGFKTQQLADSQGGQGGYQQLRLDDTPGQGRAQASTTQHDSTLTLGHLKGGRDNLRGSDRGFGVELSTQASGALRAGAGLLLTTESGQQQLDAPLARAQLAQGEQLIVSLNDAAKVQDAGLPDEASDLPSQQSSQSLQQTLQATQTGSAPGDGIGGGEGSAAGWSSPVILASSPDGIASVTPADQVWVSGTQTVLSADKDLQWLSQGAAVLTVAGGIVLYAHGNDAPAGKPNQEKGIALHAAQGAVSARAHDNLARIAAQTSVTIASTQADINVAASKHILATAAGAYLKMEGGNIELGAPGKVEFKAAQKNWTGPQASQANLPFLPQGDLALYDEYFYLVDESSGEKLKDMPYRLLRAATSQTANASTDSDGKTRTVSTATNADELKVLYTGDEDINHGW